MIKHLAEAKQAVLGSNDQKVVSSVLQQSRNNSPREQLEFSKQLLPQVPKVTRPSSARPASLKRTAILKAQNPQAAVQTANEKRLERLRDTFEQYHESLTRTFVYYCSYGEPLNTDRLRSSKFVKFLKDAKLLETKQSPPDRKAGAHQGFQASNQPHPRPLR